MILAGMMQMKSFRLETLSLTPYLPKASKNRKKAGLLTRFTRTVFPPTKDSDHFECTEFIRNLQLRV